MQNVKQKSKLIAVLLIFAIVLSMMLVFGLQGYASAGDTTLAPIYRLQFSNDTDRGSNSAESEYGSATIHDGGSVTYEQNAWKGQDAIRLNGSSVRQNYVSLPGSLMNYDSVTIAGWFYISSSISGPWSRMIEVSNADNSNISRISLMPYAENYYSGLHISAALNGEAVDGADNLFFEGADPDAAGNMSKAYNMHPVYDTWVHYAYEFTPDGFFIYQNGTLIKSKEGDFSGKHFYSSDASYIYLGATGMDDNPDFHGGFSDIRVYSSALSEAEISSEFNLSYEDFLTTQYNFENNSTEESIRGYNGTLNGHAQVVYDEERESYVLSLDGTRGDDGITSMQMPARAINGHNEITIQLDAYVSSETTGYARLFEFSPNHGGMLFSTGVKWGGSSSLLKFTKNNDVKDQKLSFDFPYNKWVNLTFTIGDNSAKIYLDGKLIASEVNFDYNNSMFWEDASVLLFGATYFYGDNPLNGKLDNIKIYQTALTSNEVAQSLGLIKIADDEEAVKKVADAFSIDYDGTASKLEIPEYGDDLVAISWESDNLDVINSDGTVFAPIGDTEVGIRVTFTRGDASVTKNYTVTVDAKELTDYRVIHTGILGDTTFISGSYYEGLMETNLDYMMSLDKERLLYNYRYMAGLDTKGVRSYDAWISTTGGGAGQFEAHYIVALAKASVTMPNYKYNGESVLDRLTYMLNEMKACQDAYAEKYPEDAGWFGAISAKQMDAIVNGETSVILDDGTKQSIWVPWYFAHKHLEALIDVYNYVPSLQTLAKTMLDDFADWVYNDMSVLTSAQIAKALRYEYGGMAEAMYQTYMITKNANHYRAAKYFEEQGLLDNLYNNVDVLAGLHSNTTIPKVLACAAAYEITGDEYYLTICKNAYEMIMKRTYANGSTSCGEFWTNVGSMSAAVDSSETCCSYNMLRLADYLYCFTGEKKYADYYENVYTNHILASMAPDTGLKTYLTNTAFGYYKIYHTAENSFWCCACTGMESFAQLTQGIYYSSKDEIKVNMFYPTTYKYSDSISIVQSGDFYTEQKTTFTINGSGSFKLSLRMPDWANTATVKINGEEESVSLVDGYYVMDRAWQDGDKVEYSVPFELRKVKLTGSERDYALMYGPILMVLDLGDDDVNDVQVSQLTFGSAYTGNITNQIVLNGTLDNAATFTYGDNGEIYMTLSTVNQGDLSFRPFNQLFHSRYGMYLEYYDSLDEVNANYTVDGNEFASEFDADTDLDAFNELGSTGGGKMFEIENGWLISPSSGENKLMAGLSLKAPYVVEIKLAPYRTGGQMNGGVYILATDAAKGQDMITAYNIHVERDAKAQTYRLKAFKFNGTYLGEQTSATLAMPDDEIISLHILVKDGYVSVFVNDSRSAALKFQIDGSFITEEYGDVGIRSQVSKMKFDGFRVISADLEKSTNVLASALSSAKAYDESLYTPETIATVKELIAEAEKVLANTDSTQAQINSINNQLRNAIGNLILVGNTSDLERALASAILIDSRNYTQASYSKLQSAINAIRAIEGQKVSQTVIDGLMDDLSKALIGLQAQSADKTSLQQIISAVEALKETDYTAESWAELLSALNASKALADNASAAEIDEAMTKLLLAKSALVANEPSVDNPSDPSEDPSNPSDDTLAPADNTGISVGALVGAIIASIVVTAAVIFIVEYAIKRKKVGKNN